MRIITLLILLCILFNCSKNEPINEDSPNQNPEEIADNVVIISQDDSNIISSPSDLVNGIYKVQFNNGVPNIGVNNIIVGNENRGFLRKVNSVSSSGNILEMKTTQATMDDLFNDVSIQFNTDISSSSKGKIFKEQKIKINHLSKGVTIDNDGFVFDFSDTVLYQEGNGTFKIANGNVTFNPNFIFDADYSLLGGLDFLEFKANKASLAINCVLDFTFSQDFNLPTFEKTLADFDKTFIVLAGGAPVVITVNTELVAELNVGIASNITYQFDWTKSFSLTTGVKYENNNWTGTYDLSSNFNINSMSFGGQANLSQNLTITPRVSLKFYDVIGPYCEPAMTEDFNFNITSPSLDWDSDLKVGLDLKTGVDISVLGKTLADFSITNSWEKPLWNAPANIEIVSGDNQSGIKGSPLIDPIKIKVTDALGKPLSFVPVYFEINQGNGSLVHQSVMTDENGFAENLWTMGDSTGLQTVNVIVKKADGTSITDKPISFNAISKEIPFNIIGDWTLSSYNQIPANTYYIIESCNPNDPNSIEFAITFSGSVTFSEDSFSWVIQREQHYVFCGTDNCADPNFCWTDPHWDTLSGSYTYDIRDGNFFKVTTDDTTTIQWVDEKQIIITQKDPDPSGAVSVSRYIR